MFVHDEAVEKGRSQMTATECFDARMLGPDNSELVAVRKVVGTSAIASSIRAREH